MAILLAFLIGTIFGIGLIIAGMANPAKVIGFLDIAGRWDPSLALVMGGAIPVAAIGFYFARKRSQSWLGMPLSFPSAGRLDRRLIGGSLLFGIGWGLAGICPGPSLVLLGAGSVQGVIFLAAMIGGLALFEMLESARQVRSA
jgi:uncharacterized protein